MEFAKAFTYPFEDHDWLRKIAILAVITLIPILGELVLLGWGLDIVRRVVRRDPVLLPELNFGPQLTDGFKAFVVSLVYSLPIIILVLPVNIISAFVTDNASNTVLTMVGLVMTCFGILTFLYGIALAFIMPAAFSNLAVKGTISAGLAFGEVFRLVRAAPVAYLLVIAGIILSAIIGQLGVILCFIGVLLTVTYAMAVQFHLYGQAYNQATQALDFRSSGVYVP